MEWNANGVPKYKITPLAWFSSVVIVYIHNQLPDLDLKVWTSFSLLSYCIIIVFDRLARPRTQDSHTWAVTGMHTHADTHTLRQVQAEWRAAVVFPALLFINLSNAIKDCQQEWQREKGGEEKEEIVIHSHSQMRLRPCIWNWTSSFWPITWRLAFCCRRNAPGGHSQEQMRRAEQVRKAGALWAAYILHCHPVI